VPWADAVVPRFLSLPACGLFVSIVYREDQANRLASTHPPDLAVAAAIHQIRLNVRLTKK